MVKPQRQKMFILMTVFLMCMPAMKLHAAQLLLKPELIVSGEYNSNIFLSSQNEEYDYISSAGLGLTGQILWRTAGIELNYTPSFNSFAYHSDLNYWRHYARLLFYDQFTRNTRFQVTNDYLETENPTDESPNFAPTDPTQAPAITPDLNRRGRSRYRIFNSLTSLSNQFGAQNNVDLHVRYTRREDISTITGTNANNYTDLRPGLTLETWFTQRWGMELDGYYSKRTYDMRNDRNEYTGYIRALHAFNRTLTGYLEYRHTKLVYDRDYDPNADNNLELYEPSVGFRYNFQENARFNLSVGYLFQDVENSNQSEDYGWLVNSEIAKRWVFPTSYIEVLGGSGYDINDSGVADLGLDIYYTGRVSLGYNFTQRAGVDIYGSYRYDKYPNEIVDRKEKLFATGAGLRYQLFQWMEAGLTYTYRHLKSSVEANEYRDNSVLLRFVMTPARPYRLN